MIVDLLSRKGKELISKKGKTETDQHQQKEEVKSEVSVSTEPVKVEDEGMEPVEVFENVPNQDFPVAREWTL